MAKYEVIIGDVFEVDGVDIGDVAEVERLAAVHERRSTFKRQSLLTYGALAAIVFGFAISAIIGWADGSYNELAAFWSEAKFFVGLILGQYFKKD